MAVARITAAPEWFRAAAAAVGRDTWEAKRLSRELSRAAERSGRTGEVSRDEAAVLVALLPGDPLAADALVRVTAGAERDRVNMVRVRGKRQTLGTESRPLIPHSMSRGGR